MVKYFLIFLAGFLSCALLFGMFLFYDNLNFTGLVISEGILPLDRVSNEDVVVLPDRVVIWIENVSLVSYKDTGSMYPTLGSFSNGLKIVPQDEDEVDLGDIISFRVNGKMVVHRVVDKGIDEEGVYFSTKGDNNEFEDFNKLRFEDIESVLIGILY